MDTNSFSKKTVKNLPVLIEAIKENDLEKIEEAIDLFDESDKSIFDEEEILEIAIAEEAYDYVDDHLDDVDLYEFRWVAAAETEEMIDYLMERGAVREPDCYDDCAFSYCVDSDYVIAFDDDFRKEVIKKYVDTLELSEDQLCDYLENEDSDVEYDGIRNIEEDAEALGFYAKDGKLVIGESDESGWRIIDVLEWMGYECKFQGCRWKLETSGYYFIDK